MKHDLTTGTWQDDTGCPISIILVTTSDVGDRRVLNSKCPECLARIQLNYRKDRGLRTTRV